MRGNALALPLADASVDLVVTSPPYFALRSYQDGGEHYDGQIGSEETPQAFLEALWAVTAECARVLKPSGSMFINLGDKYSGAGGGPGGDDLRAGRPLRDAAATWRSVNPANSGIPAKSLMLLPERFRVGCVDQLGLIARAVIVWSKPNGLPESVTDRVRRSHEDWMHLTKLPRYFSAVDEVREAHAEVTLQRAQPHRAPSGVAHRQSDMARSQVRTDQMAHPLGKLPGSVWTIPTEPLVVPAHLKVDHFAAFPQEWPRRLILGWSPPGVCVECGEGRRPVVERSEPRPVRGRLLEDPDVDTSNTGRAVTVHDAKRNMVRTDEGWSFLTRDASIIGYACACAQPAAPTRPAVVLDPFAGTGTVPMVARALGRYGVGLDLSADYLRLARWRVFESGHARKAMERTAREAQQVMAL